LDNNKTYLVFLRWDKDLNCCDFGASEYKYNTNIPLYKLQPAHYWFEINDLIQHKVSKYDVEMTVNDKSQLIIYNLYGTITDIKLFDIYNENLSELVQMYPTHNHLIINDTARKLNKKNILF
jgi:hypothetical protein